MAQDGPPWRAPFRCELEEPRDDPPSTSLNPSTPHRKISPKRSFSSRPRTGPAPRETSLIRLSRILYKSQNFLGEFGTYARTYPLDS